MQTNPDLQPATEADDVKPVSTRDQTTADRQYCAISIRTDRSSSLGKSNTADLTGHSTTVLRPTTSICTARRANARLLVRLDLNSAPLGTSRSCSSRRMALRRKRHAVHSPGAIEYKTDEIKSAQVRRKPTKLGQFHRVFQNTCPRCLRQRPGTANALEEPPGAAVS